MFIIRYLHTILFLVLLLSYPLAQAGTAIPDVIGLSLDSAQYKLDKQGFSNYSVQYQPTKHHPENTVMVQAPPPDTTIASDFPIRLIVAKSLAHLKTSIVPNLKGMSLDEAKAALAAVNLQIGHISERSIKMERIQVLYQTPKSNQRIIQQRAVNITLSDVIDQDTPRVKVILDKKLFKVGESTWIKTKTYNVDLDKKAEYGFSINGRTYYSSKPEFQYTFKQAGNYMITASFRYARSTWYASLTRKTKASVTGIPIEAEKPTAPTEIQPPVSSSQSTPKRPKIVPTVPPISSPPNIPTSPKITPKQTTTTKTTEQEKNQLNKVPNVIGLSQNEAQNLMTKANLRVTFIKKPHKTKNNVILLQSPKANKQVKSNTLITLTLATKIKPWHKPKAIIHPAKVEVIQGESALFSSHSTHDKRSKILRHWSIKSSQGIIVGRSFKVNTKILKAGQYQIKLSIKDDKNLSDKTTAVLIIKDKAVAPETAKIVQNTLSNPQLYSALLDEISHYKLHTNSVYVNSLLEEANILQTLTYPYPNISRNDVEQNPPYPSTPKFNQQGLELSYIHALLIEAKQTTDQQKIGALSETLMPSPPESNKMNSSKAQPVENNRETRQETSLISTLEISMLSWNLGIWLVLILTICFALISIIWSYRCKKKIETLNIVYQYQNDEGKQRIVKKSS